MATDSLVGPEIKGFPLDASTETGGPVRELAEALTAIGNYLAAASRILADGPTPPVERLGDVLDKSMGQYERAAKAARQLHRLTVCGGEDDDTPSGVRR
jgi:hypothetical protein